MKLKKNSSEKFKDIKALNKNEAEKEVQKLREAIEYHNYRYYVKNNPVISDAAYDRLFKRLQDIEESFPDLRSENSPTQKVGAEPVDELKRVRHTTAMLSLNSVHQEKEIADFFRFLREDLRAEAVDVVVEPKFDGFSVEVVYENGLFQWGATRGDGQYGEDITENLKTIAALPLRLRQSAETPSFLSVRGEVYMLKDDFQKLNRKRIEIGLDPFANPRNAAAGLMRQLDPRKVAGTSFTIVFYEILNIRGISVSSHQKALKLFPELGLKTTADYRRVNGRVEVCKYYNHILKNRENMEYEIDGIVMKVNDYDDRKKLGTRQRSPRWAMAWKFPPREEITVLKEIMVSVGRTGMLTPIALLDPVDVGGVTISRATLHNEDEARKKDVRPGDKVRVARAGDVIPEVVELVKAGQNRGNQFEMPRKCPVCGSKVVREGAYYFCPSGLSCPAQIAGKIIHYASRPAMDIGGLGEKTVKEMVQKKMVKDISQLYDLTKEDLLQLEGFAEKSARQLYEAIQNAKNPDLTRFIYALGIRHVGEHIAGVLAENFKDIESLMKASSKDLQNISEIGPEIARSIEAFFSRKENLNIIKRLESHGIKFKKKHRKEKSKSLEGKTFVFSGKLQNYTRDEAKKAVERLGAKAASSVSGNTDYLVAGENPGSKLNKARDENVKILEEKAFEEILETITKSTNTVVPNF